MISHQQDCDRWEMGENGVGSHCIRRENFARSKRGLERSWTGMQRLLRGCGEEYYMAFQGHLLEGG